MSERMMTINTSTRDLERAIIWCDEFYLYNVAMTGDDMRVWWYIQMEVLGENNILISWKNSMTMTQEEIIMRIQLGINNKCSVHHY